ncbi:MAG: outer membrane beta-barrel protein [Deltaproteobacteria bacterium]|nr:outer membrane beta-barrel protein [Deltaproteobacteria bacterium]
MKIRMMLAAAIVLGISATSLYGQEPLGYLEKNNAVALKFGAAFFPDNDFMSYYRMPRGDYYDYVGEFSYERRFLDRFGIEVAFGYTHAEETYTSETVLGYLGGSPVARTSQDFQIRRFYISPSVKVYMPVRPDALFYLGAGPDYCLAGLEMKATIDGTSFDVSDDKSAYGVHVLAGFEYYFYKFPGKEGLIDTPVSFIAECRYAWITVDNADEELSAAYGREKGTALPLHDLAVGGHTVMVGFRWHF